MSDNLSIAFILPIYGREKMLESAINSFQELETSEKSLTEKISLLIVSNGNDKTYNQHFKKLIENKGIKYFTTYIEKKERLLFVLLINNNKDTLQKTMKELREQFTRVEIATTKNTTNVITSKDSFIQDFLMGQRQKINDPLGQKKIK